MGLLLPGIAVGVGRVVGDEIGVSVEGILVAVGMVDTAGLQLVTNMQNIKKPMDMTYCFVFIFLLALSRAQPAAAQK
jgi:hypothetical protein